MPPRRYGFDRKRLSFTEEIIDGLEDAINTKIELIIVAALKKHRMQKRLQRRGVKENGDDYSCDYCKKFHGKYSDVELHEKTCPKGRIFDFPIIDDDRGSASSSDGSSDDDDDDGDGDVEAGVEAAQSGSNSEGNNAGADVRSINTNADSDNGGGAVGSDEEDAEDGDGDSSGGDVSDSDASDADGSNASDDSDESEGGDDYADSNVDFHMTGGAWAGFCNIYIDGWSVPPPYTAHSSASSRGLVASYLCPCMLTCAHLDDVFCCNRPNDGADFCASEIMADFRAYVDGRNTAGMRKLSNEQRLSLMVLREHKVKLAWKCDTTKMFKPKVIKQRRGRDRGRGHGRNIDDAEQTHSSESGIIASASFWPKPVLSYRPHTEDTDGGVNADAGGGGGGAPPIRTSTSATLDWSDAGNGCSPGTGTSDDDEDDDDDDGGEAEEDEEEGDEDEEEPKTVFAAVALTQTLLSLQCAAAASVVRDSPDVALNTVVQTVANSGPLQLQAARNSPGRRNFRAPRSRGMFQAGRVGTIVAHIPGRYDGVAVTTILIVFCYHLKRREKTGGWGASPPLLASAPPSLGPLLLMEAACMGVGGSH